MMLGALNTSVEMYSFLGAVLPDNAYKEDKEHRYGANGKPAGVDAQTGNQQFVPMADQEIDEGSSAIGHSDSKITRLSHN